MKKVFLILLVVLFSCKKENNIHPTQVNHIYKVTYNIDIYNIYDNQSFNSNYYVNGTQLIKYFNAGLTYHWDTTFIANVNYSLFISCTTSLGSTVKTSIWYTTDDTSPISLSDTKQYPTTSITTANL